MARTTHVRVQWARAGDGAYEARVGTYTLEAWYDSQDPYNPGWAWRVTGPGYQESGPADSAVEARRAAANCLTAHIRRGRR